MSAPSTHDNFTLKEEIRAYWSARAESFDLSFGHAIKSDRELKAFQRLIGDSFGPEPLDVLDLACGTGEITRALLSLNHRVTALDFSEAMLERARAKHGKAARFRLGDAERLLDEDASYDAAITRHLVWTLTDPEAALSEWFRVLRPGGRLLAAREARRGRPPDRRAYPCLDYQPLLLQGRPEPGASRSDADRRGLHRYRPGRLPSGRARAAACGAAA